MAFFSIVPFFLELPHIVLGLLMMWFGVGLWGKWGYLFVFGSPLFALFVLPGLVHLIIQNEPLEVLLFFVFLFSSPFIVLVPVRRYYQNRSVRKDESSEHETGP